MKAHYITEDLCLEIKQGESLLEACIRKKIPISHSCEGMASCGTCRVIITSDLNLLPPRNSLEQEMADDRGFKPEERLACQMEINHDFSFKLPYDEDSQ